MPALLVICSGCSRHIKVSEVACPFCSAAASSARPSTGEPFRRMAAAAAVAAGVTSLTACASSTPGGSSSTTSTTMTSSINMSTTVFYGTTSIPEVDAAGDTSAEDAPSVVAFYGIANPIPDAGADTQGPSDASGNSSG